MAIVCKASIEMIGLRRCTSAGYIAPKPGADPSAATRKLRRYYRARSGRQKPRKDQLAVLAGRGSPAEYGAGRAQTLHRQFILVIGLGLGKEF